VRRPERLKRILIQAKAWMKDAVSVNLTRWAVVNALMATGLPGEVASGGRTNWNQTPKGLLKIHAFHGLWVGLMAGISDWSLPTLVITATDLGSYHRARVMSSGFPQGHLMRKKSVNGFRADDLVQAVVPKSQKARVHVGRVVVTTTGGIVPGTSHQNCHLLMRADGYSFELRKDVPIQKPPFPSRAELLGFPEIHR